MSNINSPEPASRMGTIIRLVFIAVLIIPFWWFLSTLWPSDNDDGAKADKTDTTARLSSITEIDKSLAEAEQDIVRKAVNILDQFCQPLAKAAEGIEAASATARRLDPRIDYRAEDHDWAREVIVTVKFRNDFRSHEIDRVNGHTVEFFLGPTGIVTNKPQGHAACAMPVAPDGADRFRPVSLAFIDG